MGITTYRINVVDMDRLEALEVIKEAWNNESLTLENKINIISEAYYSVGLDIATTATFVKATPAEFSVFLSLSDLDDEVIAAISRANPPKTTWLLLGSGNGDEINKALVALATSNRSKSESVSEFVYQQMIEVAGKTPEQLISQLTGGELFYLAKKAKNFTSVNQKSLKFLNSLAGQKKRGKVLSDRQLAALMDILNGLVDNNVIQRNSIDGDEELCDKVLDSLGR